MLSVYGGIDTLPALLEQVEDGGIDVIVYQDDFPLCRLDEGLHQFVGIEYLTFEQHALDGRQRGADEEVDLLLMVGKGLFDIFNFSLLRVHFLL